MAPDQRGYARSAKPLGVEAYHIKQSVRAVLALAEQLSPGRPFSIVGHDWGAPVGYAAAIAAPRRVAQLVVINGAPVPFSAPSCTTKASVRPVPMSMICAGPRQRRAWRPKAWRSSRACWADLLRGCG